MKLTCHEAARCIRASLGLFVHGPHVHEMVAEMERCQLGEACEGVELDSIDMELNARADDDSVLALLN